MCPPVLLAVSLAISAASAIASSQAQNAEADSQRKYQEAQMRANNEAAVQNANAAISEQIEQTAAERMQQMQQGDAAAREKQKIQADYLQKKGAAIASSPNGAGLSFDSLLADYGRAYAMNNDVVDEQLRMQGVSADTNVKAYYDRATNRIASQQGYIPSPIKGGSSFLTSALGFGSDVLGAYNAKTNFGKDPLFQSGVSSTSTGGMINTSSSSKSYELSQKKGKY